MSTPLGVPPKWKAAGRGLWTFMIVVGGAEPNVAALAEQWDAGGRDSFRLQVWSSPLLSEWPSLNRITLSGYRSGSPFVRRGRMSILTKLSALLAADFLHLDDNYPTPHTVAPSPGATAYLLVEEINKLSPILSPWFLGASIRLDPERTGSNFSAST